MTEQQLTQIYDNVERISNLEGRIDILIGLNVAVVILQLIMG